MKTFNNKSLILANLTVEEETAFHRAGITYTGSTGHVHEELVPRGSLTPYIATYIGELNAAIAAMGWKDVQITVTENQWVARRHEPVEKKVLSAREIYEAAKDAVKGNNPGMTTDVQRGLIQVLLDFGNALMWAIEKTK